MHTLKLSSGSLYACVIVADLLSLANLRLGIGTCREVHLFSIYPHIQASSPHISNCSTKYL